MTRRTTRTFLRQKKHRWTALWPRLVPTWQRVSLRTGDPRGMAEQVDSSVFATDQEGKAS